MRSPCCAELRRGMPAVASVVSSSRPIWRLDEAPPIAVAEDDPVLTQPRSALRAVSGFATPPTRWQCATTFRNPPFRPETRGFPRAPIRRGHRRTPPERRETVGNSSRKSLDMRSARWIFADDADGAPSSLRPR